MTYIDRIAALGACSDAVEWLRTAAHPDLASAWAACQRGDWLLWLAARLSGPPWSDARRPLVLAACACAREALPAFEARFPKDSRPRHALDTAEAWCRGDATQDEVLAAQRAAAAASAYAADAAAAFAADAADAAAAAYATAYAAAAFAADAAAFAAASAAFAAASAAYAAAYAAAAAFAADAAASAAASAADASAAADARSVSLARSADVVRQHLPCPVLP